MKPLAKKTLIAAIAGMFIFLVGYGIGLQLSGNQIIAMLAVVAIVVGAYLFLRMSRPRDSSMEAARRFAVRWCKDVLKEELGKIENSGGANYFDDDADHKFYAFKFTTLVGQLRGVVIVDSNHGRFDIAGYDTNPDSEVWLKPFSLIDGYMHSSPVPIRNPEHMMPKYYDNFNPLRNKRRGGVNIYNSSLGSGSEPPGAQKEED